MESIDLGALLERLVDKHWETAARHAWLQYRRRGRGAIVFTVPSERSSADRQQPLRYLTFTGDDEEIQQGSMSELHRLVQTYDPSREVVIAAVVADQYTVFDVFAEQPSPEQTAI